MSRPLDRYLNTNNKSVLLKLKKEHNNNTPECLEEKTLGKEMRCCYLLLEARK